MTQHAHSKWLFGGVLLDYGIRNVVFDRCRWRFMVVATAAILSTVLSDLFERFSQTVDLILAQINRSFSVNLALSRDELVGCLSNAENECQFMQHTASPAVTLYRNCHKESDTAYHSTRHVQHM